jgi:hypothetical protein
MVTKQNISISVLHFTETVILSIIRERNSEQFKHKNGPSQWLGFFKVNGAACDTDNNKLHNEKKHHN